MLHQRSGVQIKVPVEKIDISHKWLVALMAESGPSSIAPAFFCSQPKLTHLNMANLKFGKKVTKSTKFKCQNIK